MLKNVLKMIFGFLVMCFLGVRHRGYYQIHGWGDQRESGGDPLLNIFLPVTSLALHCSAGTFYVAECANTITSHFQNDKIVFFCETCSTFSPSER